MILMRKTLRSEAAQPTVSNRLSINVYKRRVRNQLKIRQPILVPYFKLIYLTSHWRKKAAIAFHDQSSHFEWWDEDCILLGLFLKETL